MLGTNQSCPFCASQNPSAAPQLQLDNYFYHQNLLNYLNMNKIDDNNSGGVVVSTAEIDFGAMISSILKLIEDFVFHIPINSSRRFFSSFS